MNSPTEITRSGRHLAAVSILLCGLVACSDEADSPQTQNDDATDSVEQTHEMGQSTSDADRHASFSQPKPSDDYAAAWPYDFDRGHEGLEATVLALGDVWLNTDGAFGVQPTPYETVSGDEFGGEWAYELKPDSFGRDDDTQQLSEPREAIHRPSQASLKYDEGARVDYEHHHDGMKLFVHIDERPDGDGPVKMQFDQDGRNLDYRPSDDGMQVYHDGEEVFRWKGLIAYDADGDSLDVSMNPDTYSLKFEVDDTDAKYPITIDPLATDPDWTQSGSQSESNFSSRVVTGDVNDNGHTDILVSDRNYTGNHSRQGRTLLFLGSSTGFSSTADIILAGDTEDESFGRGTKMDTDFSGDGCDEIVIGAPGYDDSRGRALLYRPFDCQEDDPELAPTLIWSTEGEPGDLLGRSLITGDFNCNGDSDLLVGLPNRDVEDNDGNTLAFAGAIEIYDGDPSLNDNIENTPSYEYEFDEPFAIFGWVTENIGRHDGTDFSTANTCDAFAVSAPALDQNQGAVLIFSHNTDGTLTSSPTRLDGEEPDERFGEALAAMPSPENSQIAGNDINALAIGAGTFDGDDLPGYVSIVEYSDSTDDFEEIWINEGPDDGSRFGSSLAANIDVNGDTNYDLVVGAPGYSSASDGGDEGGAFIYLGTSTELSDDAQLVLESGQQGSEFGDAFTGIRDFGDDKDALIVGAPRYDGFVEDGGRVFIYPGQKTCYIDGEFYSAGDENPDNLCEVCDPEEDTDDWSDNEEGLTCDDGDDCTISACEDGECVPQDGVDCDDGNPCTTDDCVDGECVNDPTNEGEECDDDDVSCTEHVCDDGACVESIASDTCHIENTCYDDGDINPGADCLKCDASNPEEWSPVDAGEDCDNGLFCTEDDQCDGAGSCEAGNPRDCGTEQCYGTVECSNSASACIPEDPLTGPSCDPDDGLGDCTAGTCEDGSCDAEHVAGCIIDGSCYDSGEENPDNSCQVCAPEQDDTGWTIASDSCVIDGGCYTSGEPNPDNDCEVCSPIDSDNSWTDTSEGSSCDPGTDPACTSGTCDGEGTCDVEIDSGQCYINSQCVSQGASPSDDECLVCDPSEDQEDYTADVGAACGEPGCTEDDELITASVCDDNGTCQIDEIIECEPYVCDDDSLECVEACEDDDDCAGDAWCDVDEEECSMKPIADAGDDQVVSEDDDVTLDGTDSFAPSGEDLNYQWDQIAGEEVELSDDTDATPTFVAPRPEPIDEDMDLVFELIVDDGELESDPDDTVVTVSADPDENEPPVAIIEGPEEADPGETIVLDGTESWDPDGDPIVSYNWSHVGGSPSPDIDEIEDGQGLQTTAEVTFPEDIDDDTIYEIGLIVSDGLANSPQDIHEVFVEFDIGPGDDIGVEPEPDAGLPDAGDPGNGETPMDDGEVGGSGCACSSTTGGERDSEGMLAFVLLLGFALWRRRRAQRA